MCVCVCVCVRVCVCLSVCLGMFPVIRKLPFFILIFLSTFNELIFFPKRIIYIAV